MNRFDGVVRNAVGYAIAGAEVYVCTQPASTGSIPPSPLATLYTDSGGGTTLANPVTTDGNGNFFFYTLSGTYTLVYYDPFDRIPTTVFPDQAVVSPGGGTVTSVAMTVPSDKSVSGSPITSSGTLAVTDNTQNANYVKAGPTSGGAATPAYRKLVTADLPSGVGTVTSVAFSTTLSAIFSGSVSGSPITTSGTINLTLNLANQAANLFLASASSGGSSAPSFRQIAAADVCGLVSVSFSASPNFDPTLFAFPTFKMTLTGDVTSSTMPNGVPGQIATFVLIQDGTGGHAFTYPTVVEGESNVESAANAVTVQSFVCISSSLWRATGPGSTNAT